MSADDHSVTVTFDAAEFERLAAVADDPESLVYEATMHRVALEEASNAVSDRGEKGEDAGPSERSGRPVAPVGILVGFEPESIGDGESRVVMDAGARHANPMGTVHGGVICDLGDAAMGMAFASTLAEDESFTTLHLSVNYLRPVWDARLTAEGQVVSQGRTVGLVECDVTDEDDRLVARLQSTCMTLRDDRAAGR